MGFEAQVKSAEERLKPLFGKRYANWYAGAPLHHL